MTPSSPRWRQRTRRYNAGQGITQQAVVELIERPAAKCDRLMKQLWRIIRFPSTG